MHTNCVDPIYKQGPRVPLSLSSQPLSLQVLQTLEQFNNMSGYGAQQSGYWGQQQQQQSMGHQQHQQQQHQHQQQQGWAQKPGMQGSSPGSNVNWDKEVDTVFMNEIRGFVNGQ